VARPGARGRGGWLGGDLQSGRDRERAPAFGSRQLSRSGYSIGIAFAPDWGEGNLLSLHPGEGMVLQPDVTFHLIPWLVVPGKLAMGFSETVRVTAGGCELITQFERRLFAA
jgi:Xaa-Pro dipeptidase